MWHITPLKKTNWWISETLWWKTDYILRLMKVKQPKKRWQKVRDTYTCNRDFSFVSAGRCGQVSYSSLRQWFRVSPSPHPRSWASCSPGRDFISLQLFHTCTRLTGLVSAKFDKLSIFCRLLGWFITQTPNIHQPTLNLLPSYTEVGG